DLQTDLLAAGYIPAPGRARAGAGQDSRYDRGGLMHYEQGLLAQARGDFRQAVQAFERSLQYAALRTVSQRGLLSSLFGLAAREGPAAANELVSDLLQTHTGEAVLLVAFVETAVLLDNVQGNQGMEGALRALEGVLREQGANPAVGPYLAARAWRT